MSNIYYNGVPIEKVDFQKEAADEMSTLEQNLAIIKQKLHNADPGSYDYQYWTIKMHDANKRLLVNIVSLS